MKSRFLIPLTVCCLLTSCATTESPKSLAAKALLTTRQGIIASATVVDQLCSAGTLNQEECNKAAKLYKDAQPAYLSASDAFLLYLTTTEDATAQQRFQTSLTKLNSVLQDINTTIQEVSK